MLGILTSGHVALPLSFFCSLSLSVPFPLGLRAWLLHSAPRLRVSQHAMSGGQKGCAQLTSSVRLRTPIIFPPLLMHAIPHNHYPLVAYASLSFYSFEDASILR